MRGTYVTAVELLHAVPRFSVENAIALQLPDHLTCYGSTGVYQMYLVSHDGAYLIGDQRIMSATQHQRVRSLGQQWRGEVPDQLFA